MERGKYCRDTVSQQIVENLTVILFCVLLISSIPSAVYAQSTPDPASTDQGSAEWESSYTDAHTRPWATDQSQGSKLTGENNTGNDTEITPRERKRAYLCTNPGPPN